MVLPTPTSAPSRPSDATVTLETAGVPHTFRLLNPTRIGSAAECQIRLGGRNVLPVQATISWRGGAWVVESAEGAPAADLNGLPVRSATLSDGDKLQVLGFRIEFRTAGGKSERTREPAPLPRDGSAPTRAPLNHLARQQSALDQDRAKLQAEQQSWLLRLAAEKKSLEKERKGDAQRYEAAQQTLREARLQASGEVRQGRLDLDSRRRQIEADQRAVVEERKSLEEQRRLVQQIRAEAEKEKQLQSDAARRSRQAVARWFHQLQRDKVELERQRRMLEAGENRLAQAQSRVQHQLQVHSHELAGLERRIQNERLLLNDLARRRQAMIVTDKAAAPMTMPSEMESLEQLASSLEAITTQLEDSAAKIRLADARSAEERVRLAHFARHLREEEKRLDEESRLLDPASVKAMADRERVVERREAELDRKGRELEAAKSRLTADRLNWDELRTAEQYALRAEFEELRRRRSRLILNQRDRLNRLRERRREVARQQTQVAGRVSQMLRQEAYLQLLARELEELRIAGMEKQASQLLRDDPLGPESMELREQALEQRRRCEAAWARFEARLDQAILSLEGNSRADRSEALKAGEAELARLRSTLAELHLEREQHQAAWSAERTEYRRQMAQLRDEVDRLAAALVMPSGAAA